MTEPIGTFKGALRMNPLCDRVKKTAPKMTTSDNHMNVLSLRFIYFFVNVTSFNNNYTFNCKVLHKKIQCNNNVKNSCRQKSLLKKRFKSS